MAQEQGQSLRCVAGNVWNFGVQLQISEPDVFSCKLHLFPCAADYSGFVAEWTWWGWSEKKKRVAAIYESKQPACLQSEHQNKLEFFFNIFNYPAKFSVSDLRNDSFAAGGAGRRTDSCSSASFQIRCVWAPLDYLYFYTSVEGQSGD